MIVSIGMGEDGVHVTLEDGCDVYSPVRLVEMCNEARKLFAAAVIDTIVAFEPETGPQAPDAVEP